MSDIPLVPIRPNIVIHKLEGRKCNTMVLTHHYSRRCPNVKYGYGLYVDRKLVGCVVYSLPASHTLCSGVCGELYKKDVIELSRLVITTDLKNAASILIGGSLRKLCKDEGQFVVVSYADCNSHVGHVGYVYQATNWLYTGQATAEPIWKEISTGKIVSYTRRHIDVKARELGYPWKHNASSGPGLETIPQLGKYRYVTFVGNRRYTRNARSALRYRILPYPKGETRRHTEEAKYITK